MFCGDFSVRVILETSVYLSVLVDVVGESTGLVSTGAPSTRLALTSAILHGCIVTVFVYSVNKEYGIIQTAPCFSNMWKAHILGSSYHGFSSPFSSSGSLRCCSQLASPFSLVRTLVVRNTAALSPSETQIRACHRSTHTHTHHLRYFTHCRLHHSDILITICLIACMIFSPLWAHVHHIINRLY